MSNYRRPRSSVTRKPTKSSLHPHGFPTFAETLEGLKDGLANVGSHLVAAGAGILGNLVGSLANMKESAQTGDEEAEQTYQEALSMLRGSGSDSADELLRALGEELGESAEGSEEPSQGAQELEAAQRGMEVTPAETSVTGETTAEAGTQAARAESTAANTTPNGKVTCLECGAQLKRITHTHLATHGMSPQEYRKKHGSSAAMRPAGEKDKQAA